MFAKIFFIMSLSLSVQTLGIKIIPYTEISKGPLLSSEHNKQKGKGSFGDVHTGTWRGAPVAIKVFHLKSLPPHLQSEFEAYDKLHHPNIVSFYGLCDRPGKFMMVSELMPYSLADWAHKEQGHVLDMKFLSEVGLDIARGIEHLHEKGVAHKHLKSNNIFLDANRVAKIGDFGLSKLKLESSSNGAAGGEATVRWRAPETFTREYAKIKDTLDAQKQADIYSYGLLLWEMAAGKRPFDAYNETQVVQLLSVATREEIVVSWPQPLKDLIASCWKFVPSERPTIKQVVKAIEDIAKSAHPMPKMQGWSLSIHKDQDSHLIWRGESAKTLQGQQLYSPFVRSFYSYGLKSPKVN